MQNKKLYGHVYDSKERFASYWYQIHEIIQTQPENVLDVGVGNKFVAEYLTKLDVVTTTLDFDESLEPDIVGDVREIPLANDSYDTVCAFQVLEHLPFEDFPKCVAELSRVAKKYVLISLPHGRIYSRFRLPICGDLLLPKPFGGWRPVPPEHEWEMDNPGFELKKVMAILENAGTRIEKTYRIFENPYHRMFVAKVVK